MSLYETTKAAMNNTIPTAQRPNKELFNVDNIKDENVKAFIEAKSRVAEVSNEIDVINERKRFIFTTAVDAAKDNELRKERNAASNKADTVARNIDWNTVSETDYEAAINATCGVDNKQDGLSERIRDKAYLKLTLDSMSKEDIIKTFDMFMSKESQEQWLNGIATSDKYKHYLPDDETLNKYVEETKNNLLSRDPRLDPSNALSLDYALSDTLDQVHNEHVAKDNRRASSYERPVTSSAAQNKKSDNMISRLKSHFPSDTTSSKQPEDNGLSL